VVARTDRRTLALHAAVIAGFLVMAVAMWWRVWITGHPTSTVPCQCGDVSEALGFIAWPQWAILHGHNPFLSNAIYAGQGGANMLTNASWMAGALFFAPVTWLFGPVATFNVAVTLAPVVSGYCFFLAVRRITHFVPGQVVAAALYGFSPLIVTSEPFGHFFQIFLFYPPLAFICLHELYVTRRRSPVRVGVALGLLTVVQFFTGTEVLVITVVMALVGSVLAAALARRQAWEHRRRILVGLGWAGAVAAPLLAYPAWFALAGPEHIVGAAWPGTTLSGLPPSTPLNAGLLVHHVASIARTAGYYGPTGPAPGFLGFGVVLFLFVSAIAWFRKRMAWFLVGLGLAAWALSLGSVVQPLSPSTIHIWLPWRLFTHVPVVQQVIPARFSAITILAAALLLAFSADCWWDLAAEHRARRSASDPSWPAARFQRWSGVGIAVVAVAALIPLGATYTLPYVIHRTPVPAWFRHDADHLAPGTTLMVYPYPDGGDAQAMGWQAENGMRYRIIGGFAIVPGADGRHSMALSPFGGTRLVLDRLSIYKFGTLPDASSAVVRMVRSSLSAWGAQVVVVTTQGRNPPFAAGFFTAVLGRAPRIEDGAWVWYGLGPAAPLDLAPGTVGDCVDHHVFGHKLDIPDCVVAAAHGHGPSSG
jgi:hypothetical protein